MKKIISLLLALLMTFSVATVAFAEGDVVVDESATEVVEDNTTTEDGATDSIVPDLGEYDWILDLPFWTVGPALKFAKIALKLITVYLKVAKIFGLVEKDMSDYIIEAIVALIEQSQNAENGEVAEETTTEAIVTEPIKF